MSQILSAVPYSRYLELASEINFLLPPFSPALVHTVEPGDN